MPVAPDDFEQRLKRYDPELRLRWGPAVNAWVVDRKGKVSQTLWDTLLWAEQQPNCEPMDRERVISAKLGCRPVLHTLVLGNHVFDTLWADDLQQHGTKIVDKHMDRLEQERMKRRNDDTVSRQAADGISFLNRRRADPSPEEQRKVFEEILGKPVGKKSKALKHALLDAHGVETTGKPDAKVELAAK